MSVTITVNKNHGGKRQGAGRKSGALSASTISVRDLARQHTEAAIAALVDIVNNPESQERALAAKTLLERGHGKPKRMEFCEGSYEIISADRPD